MSLGNMIRKKRHGEKLTLKQVSYDTGISHTVLSHFETDTKLLCFENFMILIRYYDLSFDHALASLLNTTYKIPPTSSWDMILKDPIKKLLIDQLFIKLYTPNITSKT